MYRSLMVPLDGASFGEYALPYALEIARRSGAVVQIVHVCAPRTRATGDDTTLHANVRSTSEWERATAYLRALTTVLAKHWDVPITTALLEGLVTDVLQAHALATRADMVVMTTHSHGPVQRGWLGSVTQTLARRLPIPILLVPPRDEILDFLEPIQTQTFQHVLIPLDGSARAEAILKPAIALGTLMGARFTLLQAIDPLVGEHTHPPYAAGLDIAMVPHVQAEAQHYLQRIASSLRAEALHVCTDLVVAQPAAAILEYARAHPIDMIAIATHGRGGLARVLLGSVANAVVRSAEVPILLCRPAAT